MNDALRDMLVRRACGEFREMPGLRLTPSQAARLWAIDPGTSELLLQHLSQVGFLARRQGGSYSMPSEG